MVPGTFPAVLNVPGTLPSCLEWTLEQSQVSEMDPGTIPAVWNGPWNNPSCLEWSLGQSQLYIQYVRLMVRGTVPAVWRGPFHPSCMEGSLLSQLYGGVPSIPAVWRGPFYPSCKEGSLEQSQLIVLVPGYCIFALPIGWAPSANTKSLLGNFRHRVNEDDPIMLNTVQCTAHLTVF